MSLALSVPTYLAEKQGERQGKPLNNECADWMSRVYRGSSGIILTNGDYDMDSMTRSYDLSKPKDREDYRRCFAGPFDW